MTRERPEFKPDSVGYWTEVKLEILKKYSAAYATILRRSTMIKRFVYIDGFAGGGKVWSEDAQAEIPGSAENALSINPRFSEYHLIDLDKTKASQLKKLKGRKDYIEVYEGNCNEILLEKVFPRCKFEDYARSLCLLDPYGLHVHWPVLFTAGQMKSIEIFYNFSIMDANMNVLRHDPEKVPEKNKKRMDEVWGDRSWAEAAYTQELSLFGPQLQKTDNDALATALRQRLQKVAGFEYVPEPMPMRNSNGAIIYYLFFASSNLTGAKIAEQIFKKYREMGVQ